MSSSLSEFSFRSREKALERFKNEVFDILVIGGGITGAAVARDAISRGLTVALVERSDFAFGTSSRSSKLIHGGLRYLENFEMGLVFEALSERTLLLKTAPHLIRPLPFYWPVYRGDSHGRFVMSLGLWLYDLLALFRTPQFHQRLSKKKIEQEIPFLKQKGLLGGFRYFDASMWDDVLAVETLRAAHEGGAAVANYVEALDPVWERGQITGFQVRDRENPDAGSGTIYLKAHRTIVCAGPWTDEVGQKLSHGWSPWLKPSKGVHLIFDLKRIPIPGAMVMSNPEDGRIAFVIPRPDYGAGVVIVGTTDGPTGPDPAQAIVSHEDVDYLLRLLQSYFPDLNLSASDILSAYVGVRPLMGDVAATQEKDKTPGASDTAMVLQKVSREHHIDRGPGGVVVVAGGKYTTHRTMAEEIVNFTLKAWVEDCKINGEPSFPEKVGRSDTVAPVNPRATEASVSHCRQEAERKKIKLPKELVERYGSDVFSILELDTENQRSQTFSSSIPLKDPEGFPCLKAQLRFSIRSEMTMHLEDFFLRRVPLYASRKDHGLPWAEELAEVWAEERGKNKADVLKELEALKFEVDARSAWQTIP